jgi:hypothetical protein
MLETADGSGSDQGWHPGKGCHPACMSESGYRLGERAATRRISGNRQQRCDVRAV